MSPEKVTFSEPALERVRVVGSRGRLDVAGQQLSHLYAVLVGFGSDLEMPCSRRVAGRIADAVQLAEWGIRVFVYLTREEAESVQAAFTFLSSSGVDMRAGASDAS